MLAIEAVIRLSVHCMQLPTGGFWELQCRITNARGTDKPWAPVATCLHKTTVKVENLVPGTQYDFRARGGYHSELPGVQDTLGDFSVVSTLQTTGTKPGKAEEAACEGEKQKQPAAEDSKPKKKEKPGKGTSGAQKPAEEAHVLAFLLELLELLELEPRGPRSMLPCGSAALGRAVSLHPCGCSDTALHPCGCSDTAIPQLYHSYITAATRLQWCNQDAGR